jgi:hypothetical protein
LVSEARTLALATFWTLPARFLYWATGTSGLHKGQDDGKKYLDAMKCVIMCWDQNCATEAMKQCDEALKTSSL